MKKKLTKLLVLLLSLLAITCFALACTNEPVHTHSYSEEYSFDKDSHWFECECGEYKGKALHSLTDGKCICGYKEELKQSVTLVYRGKMFMWL